MRALAIGGGLLGLVLTIGIIGYLLVGGPPPSADDGTRSPGGGGVASPGYVGGMINARDRSAANIALATVRQRLQMYRSEHDEYPASLDDLAKTGPLPQLPGKMTYRYDAATGTVEAE